MIIEESDWLYLKLIQKEIREEFLKIPDVLSCYFRPFWNLQSKDWEIRITSVVDSRLGWNDTATDALICAESTFYERHQKIFWSFRIQHLREGQNLETILESLEERAFNISKELTNQPAIKPSSCCW